MDGMKLSWVGKYLIGAAGLYAVTSPLRARQTAMHQKADMQFMQLCKDFSTTEACKFLTAQRYQAHQIPCFFEHADGSISEFVYEPGAPEKLKAWQLDTLSKFIELYGMQDLKPALELSRDGARDEAICFLWNEKNNTSDITQLSRAVRLLQKA